MNNIPISISLLFGLTTLLTVGVFYKATNHSKIALIILLLWLALQALIGLSGFYLNTETIPPRFVLLVLPPVLIIAVIFFTKKGKVFIDGLNLKTLTILHVIRIPVELTLLWLFLLKYVPELMTFEGRNFDILSGLSAPIIYYFGFVKKQMNSKVILIWNMICLGLLINIVTIAVLSAPFPFQKLAFDQPNIAVLYFPFVWLPCCVVPLVLFSHLVAFRQLLNSKKSQSV